jgi:hypothetical protein
LRKIPREQNPKPPLGTAKKYIARQTPSPVPTEDWRGFFLLSLDHNIMQNLWAQVHQKQLKEKERDEKN